MKAASVRVVLNTSTAGPAASSHLEISRVGRYAEIEASLLGERAKRCAAIVSGLPNGKVASRAE